MTTSTHPSKPYVHLLPIEPGEMLASWLLRIAARYECNFKGFSRRFFDDHIRVATGFDAFPNLNLLKHIGSISDGSELALIRDHTLLGTMQSFYLAEEWQATMDHHINSTKRIYKHHRVEQQLHWKICPKCHEAAGQRGILTWQRNAQMPGPLFCGRHGVPLAITTHTHIPSFRPPSSADLSEQPTVASYRGRFDAQHIQLARDIEKALCRKLPHLGAAGMKAIVSKFMDGSDAQLGKVRQHLTARFGADFLEEVALDRAITRLSTGYFFAKPCLDSLVLVALLARSFDSSLNEVMVPAR